MRLKSQEDQNLWSSTWRRGLPRGISRVTLQEPVCGTCICQMIKKSPSSRKEFKYGNCIYGVKKKKKKSLPILFMRTSVSCSLALREKHFLIRGNVFQGRACCSKYVKLAQNSFSISVSTVGMERIFRAVDNLWTNGFNRLSMEWVRNKTRACKKKKK